VSYDSDWRPLEKLLTLHRYDLSIALLNGSNPVFYYQPQEPVDLYPGQLLSAPDDEMYSQDNLWLIQRLDDDLLIAYQIMRRFCLMVNFGTQGQRIINPDIIHETMTSVMYRLLHTSFAAGSIDKTVQVGLLSFSYHLFIQWQDIKLPYQHFPKTYQDCIQGLEVIDTISSRLMLWLLMTGAISLFHISNETWLREDLREYIYRCQVKTWKELQDILESFMWVTVLDEQQGKQVYHEICLSVSEEKHQSS
jgi:hypothetical protein